MKDIDPIWRLNYPEEYKEMLKEEKRVSKEIPITELTKQQLEKIQA